jgi:hypothetical protein
MADAIGENERIREFRSACALIKIQNNLKGKSTMKIINKFSIAACTALVTATLHSPLLQAAPPTQGPADVNVVNTQTNPVPIDGIVKIDDSTPVKVNVKPSGGYTLYGITFWNSLGNPLHVSTNSHITGVNFAFFGNNSHSCNVLLQFSNYQPSLSNTPFIAQVGVSFPSIISEVTGKPVNQFRESKFIPVPNLFVPANTDLIYRVYSEAEPLILDTPALCGVETTVYLTPDDN